MSGPRYLSPRSSNCRTCPRRISCKPVGNCGRIPPLPRRPVLARWTPGLRFHGTKPLLRQAKTRHWPIWSNIAAESSPTLINPPATNCWGWTIPQSGPLGWPLAHYHPERRGLACRPLSQNTEPVRALIGCCLSCRGEIISDGCIASMARNFTQGKGCPNCRPRPMIPWLFNNGVGEKLAMLGLMLV